MTLGPPSRMLSVAAATMVSVVIVGTGAAAAANVDNNYTQPGFVNCPKLQFFGVRGSGETSKDWGGYGQTVWNVRKAVLAQVPSAATAEIDYPAIPVVYPSLRHLPSFLHYIATRYHTSEIKGIKNLAQAVSKFVGNCPGSYVVLAGYSQGAQVVGDTFLSHLTAAQQARVAGIAMLGDADFNGSSRVDVGDYDHTENGVWAYGHSKRHVRASLAKKIVSYCTQGDPICNFGIGNLLACKDHPKLCPHLHYTDLFWRKHTYAVDAGDVLAARFGAASAVNRIGLSQVSAVPGTSQAWAIGDNAPFMVCGDGYVLHYNGNSWSPVRPSLATDIALSAVAAPSAKSVWVAGTVGACAASRPFLAHSSGGAFREWNLQWLGRAVLVQLSAASSSDMWAVGYVPVGRSARPLALHWNGQSWTVMPVPSASNGLIFDAVSASGLGNAWVIASSFNGSISEALHWNGKRWSAPYVFSNVFLSDIATSSSTQAWVIGSNQNTGRSFSAHWNGAKWISVTTPTLSFSLNGIAMSGTRTWAVGEKWMNSTSGNAIPEALFSTGGGWQSLAAPDPGDSGVTQSAFYGVSAASAQFAVAVGQNGIECTAGAGFADVYLNGTWRAISAPNNTLPGQWPVPDCGG